MKTIRHSKLPITLSSADTLDYEMLHAIQLNLMYDENDSREDNHSDHAYSLVPKEGRFTMFPGWIKHSVPKHMCDHERIIVAGNISSDPYHIIGHAQSRSRERKVPK